MSIFLYFTLSERWLYCRSSGLLLNVRDIFAAIYFQFQNWLSMILEIIWRKHFSKACVEIGTPLLKVNRKWALISLPFPLLTASGINCWIAFFFPCSFALLYEKCVLWMSLIIIFPQELQKCSDFMLEFHCTELTKVLQCIPSCFERDYLEFPFIKKSQSHIPAGLYGSVQEWDQFCLFSSFALAFGFVINLVGWEILLWWNPWF